MKLIMGNGTVPNEGISDVVYHYTSGIEKGAKISKITSSCRQVVSLKFGQNLVSKLYYFLPKER